MFHVGYNVDPETVEVTQVTDIWKYLTYKHKKGGALLNNLDNP